MTKRLGSVALAGIAATVFVAAPASAAPSISGSPASTYSHFINGCRARGDFATCVAGGSVNKPLSLWVHVNARPNQRVFVAWSDVCSRGLGAGSKSGSFYARTPVRHRMRMPYLHPDSCTVSADAQLQHGGNRIHVWLTAIKSR